MGCTTSLAKKRTGRARASSARVVFQLRGADGISRQVSSVSFTESEDSFDSMNCRRAETNPHTAKGLRVHVARLNEFLSRVAENNSVLKDAVKLRRFELEVRR